MLLLCSFFKLKESFEVKNGLTTSLFFYFFENAKNLGRSDDAKRRKKKTMTLTQCNNATTDVDGAIFILLTGKPSIVIGASRVHHQIVFTVTQQ